MPVLRVRGAALYHEVHGQQGPWLALTAGGRHRHLEMAPLARLIAAEGFRVVVHDRRNTGASDIVIDGPGSEEDIWADDLAALMHALGAAQAFYGGSSAGSRLALTVYRRHPEQVQGLLLTRLTGGRENAVRLAQNYYGQFIEAARSGGMAAVCASTAYAPCMTLNPASGERLRAMAPERYIEVMQGWRQAFLSGPSEPVMGVCEDELRACRVPALVVPGNDRTHLRGSALAAAQLMPQAELFELPITDQDTDAVAFADWQAHYPALAQRFVAFMRAHGHPPAPAHQGSADFPPDDRRQP